jgi:hypothetical protein
MVWYGKVRNDYARHGGVGVIEVCEVGDTKVRLSRVSQVWDGVREIQSCRKDSVPGKGVEWSVTDVCIN